MNQSGEEKNRRIRKKVFWFSVGMLLFVGIAVMAKYSLTGSATISVGIISGIIMRHIMKLKEEYDYDSPAPSCFTPLLIMSGIITILIGIVACKWLTTYIYTMTDGKISSWSLFTIIATVLVGVIVCLWGLKIGKPKKSERIYVFLMLVSACLIIAQYGATLWHNKDIKQNEWSESCKDNTEKYEAKQKQDYSQKLVGKWVADAIILGQTRVVEVFNADGTWQSGNEDGIRSKGCWSYAGAKQIKIQETWVCVGESISSSDNEWILTINYLHDDEMSVRKGDHNITYKRMKE